MRCEKCHLLPSNCICAQIPSIRTRMRLTLILHALEARRSTNTGHLAALALPNSRVEIHGRAGQAINDSFEVTVGMKPLFLFPDGSEELRPEMANDGDVELIVPDASWAQAVRMSRRIHGLSGVPHVRLPRVTPRKILRKSLEGRISTFEAISHAVQILEGEEAGASMLTLFDAYASALLRERGRRSRFD